MMMICDMFARYPFAQGALGILLLLIGIIMGGMGGKRLILPEALGDRAKGASIWVIGATIAFPGFLFLAEWIAQAFAK